MLDRKVVGLRGFILDSPAPGRLRGVRDGAVLVEDGRIIAAGPFGGVSRMPEALGVRWLHSPETVIIPGLVDIHTHLPQMPAVGRVEGGLLPWLERHVYPLEREFRGKAARDQAPRFFSELARNGTTCAMIHTAIYEDSCDIVFEEALRFGMRAVIGKVMMDDVSCGGLPSGRVSKLSVEQSERLCKKWHGQGGGLLDYAFSPRFAPGCSIAMMRRAAELARQYGAYIQTHLSENHAEIEAVARKFPDAMNYTGVYADCGLLGERSVFAHGIHLDDVEVGQLRDSKSVVAHCPTSNFFLNSGIMPLDRWQAAGLRMGLGSDVAGGPELNLWQVMRSAIEGQKARSFADPGVRIPTETEVFHMATLGGAAALGKECEIGSIDVGKSADVTVIDLAKVLPYRHFGNLHADLGPEEIIALLIYRGGPHATIETFVRGRSVYRANEPGLF